MTVSIKICCIQTEGEALLAARAGADMIGLVGAMPSGPGPIPDSEIASISDRMRERISTVLLTSETTPEGIVAHIARCNPDAVQLVDRVPAQVFAAIRAAFPALRIFQVIHMQTTADIETALDAARRADALLLDSGQPDAALRQLGGTGRVHDWALSAKVAARACCPVWLAGGLTPDNVAEAVRTVRPHGVDVCSRVRVDGQLQPALLDGFIRNARAA